jgi:hypothetical protein
MFVKNTTNRPETLSIPGRRGIKFDPGKVEITDEEYLILSRPEASGPSMFSWFVDQGVFEIEGDIPEPVVEPEPVEDKAVAKAKEKLKEAQAIAEKKKQEAEAAAAKKKRDAESKALREEISSLLKKGNGKRSMKYDDLCEDYKVTRPELKDMVAVKDLEASKLFAQWLKSEVE